MMKLCYLITAVGNDFLSLNNISIGGVILAFFSLCIFAMSPPDSFHRFLFWRGNNCDIRSGRGRGLTSNIGL